MFYREEKKSIIAKKPIGFKNLDPIESFEVLLKDKKHQEALYQIKHHLAYQAGQYQKLASPLVANVAMYYQHMPETSLYFSQRGGLLDNALYRTEAALTLMRQLMVQDEETGLPTENQKVWLYALFSASLLQGIGKLYTEYQVNIHNSIGTLVKEWEPLLEDMATVGDYYRYQFVREDSDGETLRRHTTILLAQQLMPKAGLALLSAHPNIFRAWLALLEEDREGAGSLSAILDRGDAIARQKYLNEFLEENDYLLEQGNSRIGTFLDTIPENTVERDRVIGAKFLIWVRDALESGKFVLNQEPFRAEIFPAGVVLSAETYDQFLQEHLKLKNKFIIQRAVSAWNTRSQLENTDASHEKQTVNKLHLDNTILPETVKVLDTKTGHINTVRSLDLIHNMEAYSREYARAPQLIQQLGLDGKWTAREEGPTKRLQMGIKPGG